MMLSIHTLNSLEIFVDKQALTALKNKKAQALLVFLAVQAGQAFERKHLQTLFWSDSNETKASNSLRQTLSLMRRLLPKGIVVHERRTVRVDADADFYLDIDHLADDPLLYSGRFMEGFDLKNADGWEEWLAIQRERYEVQAIEALEAAAQQAQAERRFEVAINYLQRVLAIDNWREQTHRQLMDAFVQIEDRAAALAQFEICREILQTELGADVSAETRILYERIQRGEAILNHNLPSPDSLTRFVGRQTEIATIHTLLEQTRLLTVVGMGGIGKTRLSVEAARQQIGRFRNGVWLVNLAGVEHSSEIAPTIANAIGFNFSSTVSAQTQLIDYLQHKQMLLLLDNFEHLLPDTDLVSAILADSAEITLLVSSRQRLNLRVEQTYMLAGLPTPAANDPLDAASVELFVNHARRVNHRFRLDASNSADVVRVCQLLEGLPLGLEMAASWVRLMDVAAIAEEIETNIAFLRANQHDVPERQRSLQAVFDYSWALLKEDERRVMRQLAFFRGGFGRKAYRAVTSGTLMTLLGLLDRSLLNRLPNNRYTLHPRLSQYCQQQTPPAERTQFATAVATYFTDLLAAAETTFEQGKQHLKVIELDPDRDNLLATWHFWLAQDDALAFNQIVGTFYGYARMRGFGTYVADMFTAALAHWEAANLPEVDQACAQEIVIGRLCCYLTPQLLNQSQIERAEKLLKRGILLLHQHNDSRVLSLGLSMRAMLRAFAGESDLADADFEAALYHAVCANNLVRRAAILSNWANANSRLNRHAEAVTQLEQALALQEQIDDLNSVGRTCDLLAVILMELDLNERVPELFERSLAIAEQLDDRQRLTGILINYSKFLMKSGAWESAENSIKRLLTYANEIDSDFHRGHAYHSWCDWAIKQRQYDRALRYANRGLAYFEKVASEALQLRLHCKLSLIFYYLDDVVQAAAHLQAAAVFLARFGTHEHYIDFLVYTSGALYRQYSAELYPILLFLRTIPHTKHNYYIDFEARITWCEQALAPVTIQEARIEAQRATLDTFVERCVTLVG